MSHALLKAGALCGTASNTIYSSDVFSTYLYTGNGSTQTITNGIDLAGEGGLVWIKSRSAAYDHFLYDTQRGAGKRLITSGTYSEATEIGVSSFNTNGFTLENGQNGTNRPGGYNYASWTFRKAPKFFDVVTYTGNGTAGRQIAHSLGVAPGMIIVKRYDTAGEPWYVYHRSIGATKHLTLNTTNAEYTSDEPWYNTEPTSTNFTIAQYNSANADGGSYVAYLFAHDTSTDGIIQCGSYTGNGSTTGPTVTLGWEPQFVLIKQSSTSGQWWNMIDMMRGLNVSTGAQTLGANASDAEYANAALGTGTPIIAPTATGFTLLNNQAATNATSATYIYLAIRRPNKPPTSGTQVYNASSGNGSSVPGFTAGFPIDVAIVRRSASSTGGDIRSGCRLIGANYLSTNATDSEVLAFDYEWHWSDSWYNTAVAPTAPSYSWMFRRAPGVLDVVCYVGDGTYTDRPHSLSVVPEFVITKCRGNAYAWGIYHKDLGAGANNGLRLNTTEAKGADSAFQSVPTATAFKPYSTQNSSFKYVAYLFATLAGISKVGSYTGNGSSLTLNCGFSAGARFFMCKRTDSTGDWYVWDTARGIIAGNDPHLSLNTTAVEVTTDDSVDPDNSGIIVNEVAATHINVNAATYIYLAFA